MKRTAPWCSLFVLTLGLTAGGACKSDVLIGEQARDADLDGAGDADQDAEIDSDLDGDGADLMDCEAGIACSRTCGSDVGCMAECRAGICPAGLEAYDGLSQCTLDSCRDECVDLGAAGCLACVYDRCLVEGFECISSDC